MQMPLTLPTDVRILDLLKDGTRHTPASVAYELDDVTRHYSSQRLSELTDGGFVADPYAPEESGMKHATQRGRIAGHHVHCYRRDQHEEWMRLVEQSIRNQPDDEAFYPNIIDISEHHREVLEHVYTHEPTMPTADNIPTPPDIVLPILFTLEYHRLIESAEEGGYVVTVRGDLVVNANASIDNPLELTGEVMMET